MNVFKRCGCEGNCDHPYQYKFKHLRRTFRASTHTPNYKLAVRIAEKKRNAIVGKVAGVKTLEPIAARLSEVAAMHDAWVETWYTHPTVKARARLAVTRFR